jgi:hypothetical protein
MIMERTSYAVHVEFNTEFMILKASTKEEAMKELNEILASKSALDFIDRDHTYFERLPL